MSDQGPASLTDDANPMTPDPTTGETGPKKSRTWIWVLVAVAAVALIGVAYAASQSSGSGGWLFLFGGGSSVPQVVGLPQQEAETAITCAGLNGRDGQRVRDTRGRAWNRHCTVARGLGQGQA